MEKNGHYGKVVFIYGWNTMNYDDIGTWITPVYSKVFCYIEVLFIYTLITLNYEEIVTWIKKVVGI